MYKRAGAMWQRRRNRSFRAKWVRRGLSLLRFRERAKQFIIGNYIGEDGILRSILRPIRCERSKNHA